jgi:hypothetical protein
MKQVTLAYSKYHYIVLVKVDLSIQCSKRVGDSPLSTFKTSLRAEINIETAIWE